MFAAAASNPLQNANDAALLARLNDLSQRAGLDPLVTPPATGNTLPDFLQGGAGSSLAPPRYTLPPMETIVACPFCGEPTEIAVDDEPGRHAFIQDCDVCCHPIQVRARVDPDGEVVVDCEPA